MTVEAASMNLAIAERHGAFQFNRLIRAAGYVAVVLALAAAAGTFFILMGLTPIAPTPDTVAAAMMVNGALVAFLIVVVAWEIISLIRASRRGQAAAGLHVRIVAAFSLVAAAPAVVLAITASFSLDRGLDNWFSTRTRAIVDNSLQIAQAYAEQQATQLRSDILVVKGEMERAPSLIESTQQFESLLTTLGRERNLPGVFVVNGESQLVAQSHVSSQADFPPPVQGAVDQSKQQPDRVVLITPAVNNNIIGAVTSLQGFPDLYLYVARPLDPRVNHYLSLTNDSVAEYRILEATRFGMQIAFGILFLGITVVVILSAIWLGIGFANWLVSPIRRLIDAAKEVSLGNLAVEVQPRKSDGDIGALGVTFNNMTSQLRQQRQELIAASEQNDSRRRFTEAVLSGVTAGVIGVDVDGCVTIANRTALAMLGDPVAPVVGVPVTTLLPQLEPVMAAAIKEGRPELRDQITASEEGRERTINVRVTTERAAGHAHGYVITLDDITDLVAAQRTSAWADIARRIAHEIKNPLTPIQLSAERLQRKFGRTITEDREIFDQCTDTIVRQVGDIGRMVDEFSSFARMPKPTFSAGDLGDVLREAIFLVSVSQPDIEFVREVPDKLLVGRFDARLIGQAFGNLIKNATEAILARGPDADEQGRIVVRGETQENMIIVEVIDNGIGLPRENRQRLLEPYVTTREKGTGLGLAIVTKIIEEHGGQVELMDAPAVATGGHGAMVRITLPRLAEETGEEQAQKAVGAVAKD